MNALDESFSVPTLEDFNSSFNGVQVDRAISNQVSTNVDLQNLEKQKIPININIYDNKEAVRTYIAEQDAVDALVRRFDN